MILPGRAAPLAPVVPPSVPYAGAWPFAAARARRPWPGGEAGTETAAGAARRQQHRRLTRAARPEGHPPGRPARR